MTLPGPELHNSAARHLFLRTALVLSLSVLGACATVEPPVAAPDAAATSPANPEPVAPLPEEPATPPLVCPEPEPVEPVVCPPPAKPKPCPVCPVNKIAGKLLLGSVEYVKITPPEVTYEAKIDSGAEVSSIQVSNIVPFERDGEKWVKFDLSSPEGKRITLERQVLRSVSAAQVNQQGGGKRLVVMMSATIGALTEKVEMALNDSPHKNQPVSIGRNFLHNNAIVDVSQKFIAK